MGRVEPVKMELNRDALKALHDLTRAIDKSNDLLSRKLREAGRPVITNIHTAPCDKDHLLVQDDQTLAKVRNVLYDKYPVAESDPVTWALETQLAMQKAGIVFREVESDGEAGGDTPE